MKRLLLVLSLLALPATRGAADMYDHNLVWGRHDTNMYMIGGFVGTAGLAEILRQRGYPEWKAVILSSVVASVIMSVNEFGYQGRASGSDLKAAGIGIAAGAGVHYSIRF
jgi:hypothetical protein